MKKEQFIKMNIPFNPPDISELEIEEVAAAMRSGWITTGPRTKQLEKKLADYCGTMRTVCLNSATAAEELNLRMLGIGEGDEVIVPAYTYTSTASAAIHTGATVKFIDSQPESWEMDYDKLEESITEKTKAVVPVDIGGIPCNYERIFRAVENKRNVFKPGGNAEIGNRIQTTLGRVAVVADCAHALGSTWKDKKTGSIADFSSFSFHAVKNFTTAEGGASTWKSIDGIDDEEIYRQFQLYSLHGQSKDALAKTQLGSWEYDIIGPWYKCNMTDIAAAIGLKQLQRYPQLLARRKEIIDKYDMACDEIGVTHLQHRGKDFASCGHLYLTRVPGIDIETRNNIIVKMAESGVATNVHYKPLPMMTAYKNIGFNIKDFPNAYAYYANEITLPLHTGLTDEQVEYIISAYKEALSVLTINKTGGVLLRIVLINALYLLPSCERMVI